jgi:hypothetical protein
LRHYKPFNQNQKMKKVMMIAIVGGAFALTSCKKDYSCECTSGGMTYTLTIADAKKKDAESACDTWGVIYTLGGGSCTLK